MSYGVTYSGVESRKKEYESLECLRGNKGCAAEFLKRLVNDLVSNDRVMPKQFASISAHVFPVCFSVRLAEELRSAKKEKILSLGRNPKQQRHQVPTDSIFLFLGVFLRSEFPFLICAHALEYLKQFFSSFMSVRHFRPHDHS